MIGKIAKCSLCRQQMGVYFESPTGRIICRECYLNRNTCKSAICNESTYLSLYYGHLLQHTKEDLARCMSDFEEKKKRETELS